VNHWNRHYQKEETDSLRLLKSSGNYLKKKASRNLAMGLLCLGLFIVLFVTSIDVLPFYIDAGRYSTARGTALGLFIAGWYYFLFVQYQNYEKGMTGERKVTKILSASLSNEYSMFNDVNLESMKGGNIDHIVVGPTGIFVIETKNYKGKISYYGDNWEGVGRKSPSRQARINAMRIKKILAFLSSLKSKRFWVQGIVVLADPRVKVTVKKPPEHVEVFKINELTKYIESQPKRFEAHEIEQIETEIKNRIPAVQ
jgi:hypothetical protein